MQISCPNCAKSYRIADEMVGAGGRSVRCVRCRHVWHATALASAAAEPAAGTMAEGDEAAFSAELGTQPLPPDPTAEPEVSPAPGDSPAVPSIDDLMSTKAAEPASSEAEAPVEPEALALADIPIPIEDAPPLVPEAGEGAQRPASTAAIENGPEDIESVAARRMRAGRRRRSRLRVPLPVAICALAAVCAGLLGFSKDVVRHLPQLASMYASIGMPVNLRGLDFTGLKIGNEIHDGVPVLVVEGVIVSTAAMPVDVPRLRFALRNASGAELYAWTAQPSQPVLEPGKTLPFRSRLASPPAESHDVQVRFFTHRDAVASLH